jgi:hypothetical protein
MNIFEDMDEAAVLISTHFPDESVSMGVAASVCRGKYTPEWQASMYCGRTKYTSIRGSGNSFVEAVTNLIVALKAYEAACLMQSDVTHIERNVLQIAAPAEAGESDLPF